MIMILALVCYLLQRILIHFDKKLAGKEGYSTHSTGNKDLSYNEQFQVSS